MLTKSRWMIVVSVWAVLTGCGGKQKSTDTKATGEPPQAQMEEMQPMPEPTQPPPLDQAAGTTSVGQSQSYAGWYMERAGQGLFQLCGQSQQRHVTGSAELRVKARDFGLTANTPVYVRVSGVQSSDGNELVVSQVEQFGSATPVRNCGLTGVVISAPAAD